MNENATTPLGSVGPETLIARYRHWYDHEKYANEKMIAMLQSVPETGRTDPRFTRAVKLAAHLAACRANYVEILQGREPKMEWWPEDVPFDSLRSLFEKIEADWSAYLASLTDSTLIENRELREGGFRYIWNIEGQIFQLTGHAYYHRGQISLLVGELGGTTVDTDYMDWAYDRDPRFHEITG